MMRPHRIVFCAVCLLLSGGLLHAQNAPLEPGRAVEAVLSAGETHRYQLRALELTLLSFRLESLAPSLDPMLEVYNSSGQAVISNDDYAYPDRLDAIIQAFIMPRTDVYTIEVRGFGDTAGGYRLLILPGFDRLARQDVPPQAADWDVVFNNAAITLPDDGALTLRIEGLSRSASLLGRHFPVERDFYFEAAFDDVVSATNWQVGILFRYVSPEEYYRLLVDKRGYWRLERTLGGETVAVRDWRGHPAIPPDASGFRLGVLASGQLLDVVYNGQVVGTVADGGTAAVGGLGITTTTASALGGRVSFDLAEAVMTLPTRVDSKLLFPQQVSAGNYTATANLLARRGVIPAYGEARVTLPQSSVRNRRPGITRLPVASGIPFGEFVIGAEVSYEMYGDGEGGCGIVFHHADGENYTLAYVNVLGEYGVSRRQGEGFLPGIFGSGLTAQDSHDLLVIVHGGRLYYYINGGHVGTMAYAPQIGELGTAVVNFAPGDTHCIFEDLWLWSLDDEAPQP